MLFNTFLGWKRRFSHKSRRFVDLSLDSSLFWRMLSQKWICSQSHTWWVKSQPLRDFLTACGRRQKGMGAAVVKKGRQSQSPKGCAEPPSIPPAPCATYCPRTASERDSCPPASQGIAGNLQSAVVSIREEFNLQKSISRDGAGFQCLSRSPCCPNPDEPVMLAHHWNLLAAAPEPGDAKPVTTTVDTRE